MLFFGSILWDCTYSNVDIPVEVWLHVGPTLAIFAKLKNACHEVHDRLRPPRDYSALFQDDQLLPWLEAEALPDLARNDNLILG